MHTNAVPQAPRSARNKARTAAQPSPEAYFAPGEEERVKTAHRVMMGECKADYAAAAISLINDKSLPAVGLRALLWSMLGEADEVLSIPVPTGHAYNVDDLNGLYWLHYGRYVAYYEHRDFMRALMEIGVARSCAQHLRDPYREQLLNFEAQEVAVQLGCASSAEIAEELEQEMNPGRRAWHHADHYVASLLQQGEYAKAAEVAPPTHTFYYLARALQGQTLPNLEEADDVDLKAPQAWANLWAGEMVEPSSGATSDVIQTYCDLAYAGWLASNSATARLVPGILGRTAPLRLDQAALWAVIQLQALSRGAIPENGLNLSHTLSDALERIRDVQPLLTMMRHLFPEGLIIGASGPRPSVHLQGSAISFIADRRAGQTGPVLAGYLGDQLPTFPGRLPNMGIVLRGIRALIQMAEDEQQQGPERVWRLAFAEIWEFASPHTRQALQDKIDHCFFDSQTAKLEA